MPDAARAVRPAGLASADLIDDSEESERTLVDDSIVAPIEAWPDEEENTPTRATPLHLVAALRAVTIEGPGEATRVVTSPIGPRASVPELLAGPPSSDPLNPSYVPPAARSSMADIARPGPPSSSSGQLAPIALPRARSTPSRSWTPPPPPQLAPPPPVRAPQVSTFYYEPPPARWPWLPILIGAGLAFIAVILFFVCWG